MSAQEFRSKIDAIWDRFWSGGVTNPIAVIEQVSYLMFARLLDLEDTRKEKMAKRLKKQNVEFIFPKDKQHLRWEQLRHQSPTNMFKVVTEELFPFFRNELQARTPLAKYLSNAQCLVTSESLMVEAIERITELPLEQSDLKGDLYEYMLGKLSTAGIAGQFRTPRHIIEKMVEMVDPKPTETVCDPACGTAGFLVATLQYLNKTHTSPDMVFEDDLGNKHYPGDLLEPYKEHINNHMLNGFDFDATMLRIAAMNLLLHDVQSPCIQYQDTLNDKFAENFPKESEDYFDVVLANPPFKGAIDADGVDPVLRRRVKTTKTELLFLMNFQRMLKVGGRAAVIVPDGVLFGSSRAHLAVRQMLIDENQLEAVISLPSGVFRPYAGVSTAILIFSKGGRTDNVWFYGVANDGLSLDDKRNPIKENDLPDLLKQWKKRNAKKDTDVSAKHFFVPVDEVRKNKYDLSYSRYHEEAYEETQYDSPKAITKKLRKLEKEISKDLDELEGMLK
jgi:type I restriction enzyme M protein